jgi:N-acetylmuramoyl-L-alanine amidase
MTSYTLRNEIMNQYQRHQPDRGFIGNVSHRDLYVMRNLEVPNILLEVGNIQNNNDRERIFNSNNRQAIANWLFEGFLADYKRVTKQQ